MLFRSFVFLISGLVTLPLLGGGWPQFRGPNRDSISTETGLLRSWPAAGPKVLWKTLVAQGYAGAAIKGATKPASKRTWLLHTIQEPKIDGSPTPASKLIETQGKVGCDVLVAGKTFRVMFNSDGPTGGTFNGAPFSVSDPNATGR